MRTWIGLTLVLVASGLVAWLALWSSAGRTDSFLGFDLAAYTSAAKRLIDVGTPYSIEVMTGPVANVPANVPIGYFYPPPLAQAFTPIASVPYRAIAPVWIALQLLAAVIVFPFLLPTTDRRRRVYVTCIAILISQPFQVALLGGNVSGWIAIGIGALLLSSTSPSGGAVAFAGALASAVAIVKLTPTPMFACALANRKTRRAASLTAALIFIASIAASPRAWMDWFAALPNILRNEMATSGANLSPAHAIADLGLPTLGGIAEVALAVAFAYLALRASFRDGQLSARAITMAAASLTFASSTLWDHYLAVLVPLSLYWWLRVDQGRRNLIWAVNVLLQGMWLGLEGLTPYRIIVTAAVIGFFFAVGTGNERSSRTGGSGIAPRSMRSVMRWVGARDPEPATRCAG